MNNQSEMSISPAVVEARSRRDDKGEEVLTLDSGVRVRVKQVPPGLMQDVLSHIKKPKVPMWFNEDKGREEPNPNHPDYVEAVRQYEMEQTNATMDAIALFGVELVDGLPEDDTWLRQLRIMSRRNNLELGEYDLDDEIDLKFLYTRYIAFSGEDFMKLSSAITGMTPEEVEAAQEMFPGN